MYEWVFFFPPQPPASLGCEMDAKVNYSRFYITQHNIALSPSLYNSPIIMYTLQCRIIVILHHHNVSISLVKQSHQDNLPRVQCSRFCLTEPVKGCFCHKMALLSSKYRVNIYLLKTRQLPGNALVILSFMDIFQRNLFLPKRICITICN